MSQYKIGVSKQNITPPKNTKIQLQGFADPSQISTGILNEIFSRAFVIQDEQDNPKKIAIAIVEIWSCTKFLKREVLNLLRTKHKIYDFSDHNVHIAGTHTHSAPAGYVGYKLYRQPLKSSGRNNKKAIEKVRNIIAKGIAKSIAEANKKMKNGKIFYSKGIVENCGQQRSVDAYNNNPLSERNKYNSDTDQEMVQIHFTHNSRGGDQQIGLINWYGLHPTSMGQYNLKICGDHKGEASRLFEKYAVEKLNSKNYVAAFANANGGDVSGNIGIKMSSKESKKSYVKNRKRLGKVQFAAARTLMKTGGSEVNGNVMFWHKRINFANFRLKNTHNRTWPYTLGLSFAAGSSEDGKSVYDLCGDLKTVLKSEAVEGLTSNNLSKANKRFLTRSILGFQLKLGSRSLGALRDEEKKGHLPKAICFVGKKRQEIVPSYLPLQIMLIGNFALLGIPAEPTSMAGRRMKKELLSHFSSLNISGLALGTYANDYSQYITTRQEYAMQHYEGASTAFGPYTLQAYIEAFKELPFKEDQYIDCTNNSSLTTKFVLEYIDVKGSNQKLSYRRVTQNFRFSLPHDALSAKVRASVKRGNTWTNKKWQQISLTGSGTAQSVIFNGQSIEYSGEIEPKIIECSHPWSSSGGISIVCEYTVKGQAKKKKSDPKVQYYYEFTLPWNAANISLYILYDNNQQSTNRLNVSLGSHQKVRLDFSEGAIRNKGFATVW